MNFLTENRRVKKNKDRVLERNRHSEWSVDCFVDLCNKFVFNKNWNCNHTMEKNLRLLIYDVNHVKEK